MIQDLPVPGTGVVGHLAHVSPDPGFSLLQSTIQTCDEHSLASKITLFYTLVRANTSSIVLCTGTGQLFEGNEMNAYMTHTAHSPCFNSTKRYPGSFGMHIVLVRP